MKTSFWIFIVVSVILVTFSVQNSGPTEISFLIWTIQISKAVIIIATFLIGLITGALYGYFSRKPKKVKEEKPTLVIKKDDSAAPDEPKKNDDEKKEESQ